MQTYILINQIISAALVALTTAGLLTFLLRYKPLAPWKHGDVGRHLIYTFWALLGLYGGSILIWLLPLPDWLTYTFQTLVFAGVCFVVWQRTWLHHVIIYGITPWQRVRQWWAQKRGRL